MKLVILALSMVATTVVAMNNSNAVCKDPYAEASMFLLLRDVYNCNNYAYHAGCQQMKASLRLYHNGLCGNPSDNGMQKLCNVADDELNVANFIEQLMQDHSADEECAKNCALILYEANK